MSQMPLFGGGRDARDAALQIVTENEKLAWRKLHDEELRRFLIEAGDAPFMSEDFRRWFVARGHDDPHHPNVWGALWRLSAADGLIVKTGKVLQMRLRTSHARLAAQWRRAAA